MRQSVLLIALVFLSGGNIFSQDNQYNTQQFGARSSMLGGAVIAGVNDNSAVFYNPGNLAFIETPSLSVSANVYKISVLRMRDAVGEGLDLHSTRFSLYPNMLSGILRFKKTDRFIGSYALITRHYGNEKAQVRQESFFDIYPTVPNDEEFIGSFEYESRIFEQWGGFGVGYRVNDKLSVGVSQFISYRSHVFKVTESTRAILMDDSDYLISSITDQRDVVLDLFRLIWKAGIHFRKNTWKFGWTLTTPALNVLGLANVSREISAYNYLNLDSGKVVNVLALDRQKNLPSRYRTPVSIAFGFEKKFSKSLLMFSAEYFSGIKKYQVVVPNPEPFLRPSTFDFDIDQDEFLSVLYAADPVINLSVGYEHTLSEKYTLDCSIRTDFSALDPELVAGNEMIISNAFWHLYHATLGVSVRKGATLTTLGLTYSLGFSKQDQNLERFDRPDTIYRDDVVADPLGMKISVHALAITIGITYFSKRG